MDNTVNKKTRMSKKFKNQEHSIDSNENQPALGKKRKKLDNGEGLPQPKKSKKKKIDIVTDDMDNMLNNISQEGSSQIIKRSKTRSSKLNIEVNSVETEDNIENINQPIKVTKKSKKKVKDENSQGEANIQISEPVLEDVPVTRQRISKIKKKKIKAEELHTELDIKPEEDPDINAEFLSQILEDCSSNVEIKSEENIFNSRTNCKAMDLMNVSTNSQGMDESSEIKEEKTKKKHRNKIKMNELQNQDQPMLNSNLESSDTDRVKKKTKRKVKKDVQPDCSNGLNNILADFLPMTFGQAEPNITDIYENSTGATESINTIEDMVIPVKKQKKSKTSQLVSNEENVIVSSQNDVIDRTIKTGHVEIKKNKTKTFQGENESLIEVGSDLNMLTLNNNDVGMKAGVNIIDIKSEETGENNENIVHISIRDVCVPTEENDLLNQLEKKLTSPQKRDPITWSQYDLQKLLSRIELCIPQNDNLPFIKRLDRLQWDSITFDNYTVEQCKDMWFKLQKRVRKFRLLNEVLFDAKDWVRNIYGKSRVRKKKTSKNLRHPDMPRKPLTPYFIYYLEHRDAYQKSHLGIDASSVAKALAKQFTSLPPDIKKKYDEISIRNREQYNKDIEEFYRKHPEIPRITPKQKAEKPPKPPKIPKPPKEKSPPKPPKDKVPSKPRPPFFHFYLSQLDKDKDNCEDKNKFKELCKENWKQLPERNKLVWIHFAEAEAARYEEEMAEYVKKHPNYMKMPIKPILTREDIQIKDRAAGKPAKPPGSAYNLFASTLLHSDSIKDVPVKDRLLFASNQWKYCTEEEKKHYKDKFEEAVKKYLEDYNLYLETLSEEQRKIELAKIVPKKLKPEKRKEESEKKKEGKKKPVKEASQQNKRPSKQPKTTTSETINEIKIEPREKLEEPEQPPRTPMKYFATLFTGTEPVAMAWKVLTKEQRKFYEEELDKKKREYIVAFEKFLKSMTKEELAEFSSSRKKMKEQQEEEQKSDEDSNSEDSDESSDEGEGDDEDDDEDEN